MDDCQLGKLKTQVSCTLKLTKEQNPCWDKLQQAECLSQFLSYFFWKNMVCDEIAMNGFSWECISMQECACVSVCVRVWLGDMKVSEARLPGAMYERTFWYS